MSGPTLLLILAAVILIGSVLLDRVAAWFYGDTDGWDRDRDEGSAEL